MVSETGREQAQLDLGDVCVLGLGVTGEAAAWWCAAHLGREVRSATLYSGAKPAPATIAEQLEAAGVHMVGGTEELEGSYDLCVCSPGIAPHTRFFQSAQEHAREVVSEVELSWRLSPERWLAITGTNGKTTTTSLATHLLESAGCKARAVGNIGVPPISCVDERQEGEWLVAELSSFQLQNCYQLHPQAACLLNITPDHLSWHGSMEAYAQAKERIFRSLGETDLAVLSHGDSACDEMRERLEARGLDVCVVSCAEDPGTRSAGFVEDDALVVRLRGVELLRMPRERLQLAGAHNVQNALSAAALVLHAGVNPSAVAEGLASFAPLEHRVEPCGAAGGVRFVNDSKATNTDATEKALASFTPGSVIVLLGGHDKGTDLRSLARVAEVHACLAVCYGEAGPRIASTLAEFAPSLAVAEAPHMAEALETACEAARDGQTVLLSPACSSFDEFKNFEERGEVFKRLVAAHLTRSGASQ